MASEQVHLLTSYSSMVRTQILSAWHWADTAGCISKQADPTGLPVIHCIATQVKFQRNQANFQGKLLSQYIPVYIETNFNSF